MLIVRYFGLAVVTVSGILISYLPWLSMTIAQHSFTYYTKSMLTTNYETCPITEDRTIFDSGELSAVQCLLMCHSYQGTCAGATYNTVEKKCKGYGDANHGVFCSQDVATTYYIKANTYVGCFLHDPPHPSMNDLVVSNNTMTNTMCCNVCKTADSNNVYFATKFAKKCYCGLSNANIAFTRMPESYCRFPCSGEISQVCGGVLCISLYHIAGMC